MSTPTVKETADGLRALAEFCEEHPDFGARIGRALRCFPTPIHPRTVDELTEALEVPAPQQ